MLVLHKYNLNFFFCIYFNFFNIYLFFLFEVLNRTALKSKRFHKKKTLSFFYKSKFTVKKKILFFMTKFINLKKKFYLKRKGYNKLKPVKQKFRFFLKNKKKFKIFSFLYFFKNLSPNLLASKIKLAFKLNNRIFLNEKKLFKPFYNIFFHKTNKILAANFLKKKHIVKYSKPIFFKKKLILANLAKKLAWKMHKGRIIHWKIRTFGNLNEKRYNKLLGGELTDFFYNNTNTFLNFIIFSCYNLIFSWIYCLKVIKYNLIFLNGRLMGFKQNIQVGDIIQLPYGFPFFTLNYEFKKKYSKIFFKTKKFNYRKFAKVSKQKKPSNSAFNKLFKKLPVPSKKFENMFVFDSVFKSLVVKKTKNFYYDLDHNLVKTSVLTLQNWRYKFD